MLAEVPPQDRLPIIRAYSHRPGRSTAAAAREARTYFGLGIHPSEAQLQTAAGRYPVFLIEEPQAVAGDRGGPDPATSQAPTPAAPAGRLGTVLLVASAAGAPLSLLALRHLGRWGRVLVQHQELGIFGHLTPGQHHQSAEQTANEQVDDREDHPAIIPARKTGHARSNNRAQHDQRHHRRQAELMRRPRLRGLIRSSTRACPRGHQSCAP